MAAEQPERQAKTPQDEAFIRRALLSSQSSFFTCLDEEQLERFVAVAEEKVYSSRQVVIREGCVDDFEESEESVTEVPKKAIESKPERDAVEELSDWDELDDPAGDQPEQQQQENQPLTGLASSHPVSCEPSVDAISLAVSPPRSGVKRSVYIVKSGTPEVWYDNFRPTSLLPGTVFGEGGFLFGRQHSASVVAPPNKEPLVCWVVDFVTFRDYVLPSDNMKRWFDKLASAVDSEGDAYMTLEEFVQARIRQENAFNITTTKLEDPMSSLRIVHSFHRTIRDGRSADRIYLEDFCYYHLLLDRPDPEVDIAFLLMDQRQTGQIFIEDLARFVEPLFPDLDLTTQFFRRYFGTEDHPQAIRQGHFSQFLIDFQREIGKQAFLRALTDRKNAQGYLDAKDFLRVLTTSCGWRLPQGVTSRLHDICLSSPSSSEYTHDQTEIPANFFAYGDFLAFQGVLDNLSGVCNLIDRAQESKDGPLSADDFKVANRALGLGGKLSRRQVEIIFNLFDLNDDGYISREDAAQVCGIDFVQRLVALPGRGGRLTFAPAPSDYLFQERITSKQTAQSTSGWFDNLVGLATVELRQLGLWVIAGSVGTVFMAPIDFAKTRVMNEQIRIGKSPLYSGWIDCLRQAVRTEGILGPFRGLGPQLLCVGPEKAMKFQVGGVVRGLFESHSKTVDGGRNSDSVNVPVELFVGACAGASQILVTSPMEMVKIRLQLHEETRRLLMARGVAAHDAPPLVTLFRRIGFPGVYRGANACLIRDVSFNAILFPTYALTKKLIGIPGEGSFREGAPANMILAGALAGTPAALMTNPADVLKTRLQAIQQAGETPYSGLRDCFRTVYRQEGWQAFFRGSTARVLKVGPQFGLSLFLYEKLSHWITGHST